MTHCPVCGAEDRGFLCRACLDEIRRTLTGIPNAQPSMLSLLHEVSVLATKQTHIYRANGRTVVSDEPTDAEYDEAERWEWLALTPQERSTTAKSALPSTATMVNLGARDLYDEAVNTLSTWARHLNESGTAWTRRVAGTGFIVTLRGEAPDTIADILAWLLTNLDAIRWDEAADEIHRDLTRLHARMRRAVDRIPSRVFAGPCEEKFPDHADVCRRPLYANPQPHFDTALERQQWETDNPIVCDGYRPPFDRSDSYDANDEGCGATHERAARRDWMLADIEDRLLPLSLLQDALPGIASHLVWPKRSTWWKWTRPTDAGHRMLYPKTVIDGVEFYRGGDVIDLVTRQQKRIIGNTENHRTRKADGGRIAG